MLVFVFFFTRGTWIHRNTVTLIITFPVVYWDHLSSEGLAALACSLSLIVLSELMCQESSLLGMQNIMRLAIKLTKALFPLNNSLLIKSKMIQCV